MPVNLISTMGSRVEAFEELSIAMALSKIYTCIFPLNRSPRRPNEPLDHAPTLLPPPPIIPLLAIFASPKPGAEACLALPRPTATAIPRVPGQLLSASANATRPLTPEVFRAVTVREETITILLRDGVILDRCIDSREV